MNNRQTEAPATPPARQRTTLRRFAVAIAILAIGTGGLSNGIAITFREGDSIGGTIAMLAVGTAIAAAGIFIGSRLTKRTLPFLLGFLGYQLVAPIIAIILIFIFIVVAFAASGGG